MRRSTGIALCVLVAAVCAAAARPPVRPNPADRPTARPNASATRPSAATRPATRPAATRATTRPKASAPAQPAGPTPAAMLGAVPGHFRPAVAYEGVAQGAGNWLNQNYTGKVVSVAGMVTKPTVKTNGEGKTVVSFKLYGKKPERLGKLAVGLSVPIELTVDAAEGERYAQVEAGTAATADVKVAQCGLGLADPKAIPEDKQPGELTLSITGEAVRVDLAH